MNNNRERRFYLSPVDSRKSFYNKCYVIEDEYGSMLYSYNTLVARYIPGRGIIRSWSGYSPTTMRHINAYAAYLGINKSGKKWWDTVEYL